MTDLSVEENEALEAVDHIGYLIRRFATIKDREAGEHLVRDLATIRSALTAREYSKQLEEELRGLLVRWRDLPAAPAPKNWTDHEPMRQRLVDETVAALAENGDSEEKLEKENKYMEDLIKGLMVTISLSNVNGTLNSYERARAFIHKQEKERNGDT